MHKHFPSAPLSDFVKCFWYSEGTSIEGSKECLLPNGEPSIIFNLRDDEIRFYTADGLTLSGSYKHALISGARSRCFLIDCSPQDRVFGIQFIAGGSYPFFRASASEFANQSAELTLLWGARVAELRERLLQASDQSEMFRIAEQILLRQPARPLELHPAVRFARDEFRSRQNFTINSMFSKIGMSQRRFIEIFQTQIGLAPKAFFCVQRFQRILRMVRGLDEVRWARVALDCGYYDQAHFIHDFREFSGLTPTQYLSRATDHLNHLPIF